MSGQQDIAAARAVKKDAKDAAVRALAAELESMMRSFIETEGVNSNLTGAERKRLVTAGVKNYGFIDKSFDIARDNPAFMPPHFNVPAWAENMRSLEDLRQLMLVSQQFTRLASDAFLVEADSCYHYALRVYGSLQEQARNRVPGAEPLFAALRTFFHRTRSADSEPGKPGKPTEKKLKKDAKRLIEGKADGEILIENESPHASGGLHEVIDSVHAERAVR